MIYLLGAEILGDSSNIYWNVSVSTALNWLPDQHCPGLSNVRINRTLNTFRFWTCHQTKLAFEDAALGSGKLGWVILTSSSQFVESFTDNWWKNNLWINQKKKVKARSNHSDSNGYHFGTYFSFKPNSLWRACNVTLTWHWWQHSNMCLVEFEGNRQVLEEKVGEREKKRSLHSHKTATLDNWRGKTSMKIDTGAPPVPAVPVSLWKFSEREERMWLI